MVVLPRRRVSSKVHKHLDLLEAKSICNSCSQTIFVKNMAGAHLSENVTRIGMPAAGSS
jgi:hypothetical protein